MDAIEFGLLLREVTRLNLKIGSYALFGSAPMGVRAMKRPYGDIDIIVTERVWDEYKHKKGWKLHSISKEDGKTEYLEKNRIEIYHTWGPGEWDMGTLIDSADTINGLQFVKLEYVRTWKQRRKAPKDIEDIDLINNYLNNRTL